MSRGIVVDHKGNGIRYAISERNFNDKVHKKVRDLKPGESVISFRPVRRQAKPDEQEPQTTTNQEPPTSGAPEQVRKDK